MIITRTNNSFPDLAGEISVENFSQALTYFVRQKAAWEKAGQVSEWERSKKLFLRVDFSDGGWEVISAPTQW